MLIKGIVSKSTTTGRKGDPIPMSPEQAIPTAVLYGLKKQHNSKDKTYWIKPGSVVTTGFAKTIVDKVTGDWTASAEGNVSVGHLEHALDDFHAAKPYGFLVQYKSSKDTYGLPDIAVTGFALTPKNASVPQL